MRVLCRASCRMLYAMGLAGIMALDEPTTEGAYGCRGYSGYSRVGLP